MRELWTKFQEPQDVLALAPEELGAIILFVLKTRADERKTISPYNEVIGAGAHGDTSRGLIGCPRAFREEIMLAVSEAFSWLKSAGFLVPAPESTGDWYVLSRRAQSFSTDAELQEYARSTQLPRNMLHASLRESVWNAFLRRDYTAAVFQAMREVEIAVRNAAGYAPNKHGVAMIREAFNPKGNGPLADPEQLEAEADALMHLFSGAIGSYKNPHSHRNVDLNSSEEAAEIILLASHLLKIVDTRARMAGR